MVSRAASGVSAVLETDAADGCYRLRGVLDFATVPDLLNEFPSLSASGVDIEVDLSAVNGSNSAGLGLLLEWLRQARLAGKNIHFRNMPEGMVALVRASDLDGLIPAGE